jgi:hypothetical protein
VCVREIEKERSHGGREGNTGKTHIHLLDQRLSERKLQSLHKMRGSNISKERILSLSNTHTLYFSLPLLCHIHFTCEKSREMISTSMAVQQN